MGNLKADTFVLMVVSEKLYCLNTCLVLELKKKNNNKIDPSLEADLSVIYTNFSFKNSVVRNLYTKISLYKSIM